MRIADILRSEATAAVAEMKALEVRTTLLTGDRKDIAAATAKELGVDEVDSELIASNVGVAIGSGSQDTKPL
jgi:cation transport ATPase